MTHDPDRSDPDGTRETVPPPQDPYSAATRVGTLPEHVLEAMRQHVPDASLVKRTKSGMQRSATRPLAAPALPSFAEAAALPPALAPASVAPAPAVAVAAPIARPQRRLLMGIAIIVMFAALGALLATVLVFAAS